MAKQANVNEPAKYLVGQILDGWEVLQKVTPNLMDGGKRFSESYQVAKNGRTALLKAIDLSLALSDADPSSALLKLTKSYEFEKELYELCSSKRMSRVVEILSTGTIPALPGGVIPVPYIILEHENSDIKSQIDFDSRLDVAWLLRILHNVSIGLWQLHGQGIAHTDLRPEHIIEFSKKVQKLTELGMSDQKGVDTPNNEFLSKGDPAYLTPEYLYGHTEADWVYKSQGADIYHLGNLIFFLFTQTTFNTWMYFRLDEFNSGFRPGKWGGTFQDILPYLIDAYDYAILFFTAHVIGDQLKSELEITLRQLCHPDPQKRGHPKNKLVRGSSMSVERYISQFARLARLAELNLLN